jgi:uncharacterized protein YutE (UPF0331/DUF86 family)
VTPKLVSKRVAIDRLEMTRYLLAEIRALSLHDKQEFFSDRRNVWAAESCLRRSLEALFDLGRHILAKAFGEGVSEYKEIASKLSDRGVLAAAEADLFRMMAGYRNRLVHFYHDVSRDELFEICAGKLTDLEVIAEAFRRWIREHPDKIDEIS